MYAGPNGITVLYRCIKSLSYLKGRLFLVVVLLASDTVLSISLIKWKSTLVKGTLFSLEGTENVPVTQPLVEVQ